MKQFPRKTKTNRVQLLVEELETRCVPCVTEDPDGAIVPDADGDYVVGSPAITDPAMILHGGDGGSGGSGGTGGTIPALSSRPGAPASLYLNFGGDNVSSWLGYSPGVIPAFTGSSTTMKEIWQAVADNYSPFNINVTTVKPTSGMVSQQDIGGNGSWTGGTYGGIGQVGGVSSSSASNPVRGFVFPDNLGSGYYWYVADASSHEAGHNMGLQHQSSWSGSSKTAEYQSGPGDGTAPTMGNSYSASRSMWWYGLNTNDSYQNDMNVISSNSFGYAPLATGTTPSTAHALTVSGSDVSAAGVLESMTQTDYWSFSTGGGTVSFTVSHPYSAELGATYGNLQPKMEITDGSGSVVVSWQDNASASVSWSGSLPGGSYRIVVSSHGISSAATSTNYGFDVGAYTISGTLSSLPAAPTVTATADDQQVTLNWDSSGADTTYNIYQATTSGAETLYVSGVTGTSFTDTGLTNLTTYFYQVSAVNSLGESPLSSEVSATPDTPPTIATDASADVNPVTGLTTNLSVLGTDDAGEATLTYTWIVTNKPSGVSDPSFTFGSGITNGTNGAKNTTATFSSAGAYTFQATITNVAGQTVTSIVDVTVNQMETGVTVSPSSASVPQGNVKQFTATALDQFSHAMANQPTFTWSVVAGGKGGTIDANGLYTAPVVTGTDTIRATDAAAASFSGTASVTITVATAPSAPSNLAGAGTYNSADPSFGAISLVWKDNASNETRFSVERSTDNNHWSELASLPPNSIGYIDTNLTPALKYYYRVRAFNGPKFSNYTSSINVIATATAPSQPGSLSAKAVSGSQINLTWQDKAINETSYSLERSLNKSTWFVIASPPANSTSYSDTGLSVSTKYYYRIRCFDGPNLVSNYSSTVNATTPAAGPLPGLAGGKGSSHGPHGAVDGHANSDAGALGTFSLVVSGSSANVAPTSGHNGDVDRHAKSKDAIFDALWLVFDGSSAGFDFDNKGDGHGHTKSDATFDAFWRKSDGWPAGFEFNNDGDAAWKFATH